jgi:heat shock protein HslJ
VIGISFSDTDLTATAGCNSIGGAYELAAGTITVTGDLRTTNMMCEDRGAQDSWLTTWLQSGVAVTATPDGLRLTGDGVTVELMEDTPGVDVPDGQPTPPITSLPTQSGSSFEQLVGPSWTVHSLTMGGSAVGTVGPPAPTLRFSADGTVEIDTGCTTVTKTYEIEGGDGPIRFGPPAIAMDCPPGMSSPGHYAVVLITGDPVRWSITGDDLTLEAFDGGVIASPS